MSSDGDTSTNQAPVSGPAVWRGQQMSGSDKWLYRLTSEDLAELNTAVQAVSQRGVSFLDIDQEAFKLPMLGSKLSGMREEILRGRGFVQLRGLPVGDLSQREAALMFWGVGRHLGDDVVSQNKHGHALGHVRNLGQSRTNASERGPYSAERIPWHVDCCDIVGLMCLQPSVSGGESSIASSSLVYNLMLERRPDLVTALCGSLYRDRRDEVPPGMPPWYNLPVFNHYDGVLSVSIEPTYIGSAGRHFDTAPNSAAQSEGVALAQSIADEIRLDIPFESGDMQFLNNYTVMHTRQAFVDAKDPERRRHLLRMWLINYDGRPLSNAYYERHGTRDSVRRPGGIVGEMTQLNCPLDA